MKNDLIPIHYAKILTEIANKQNINSIVSKDLDTIYISIKSFKLKKLLLSYTVPKIVKHKLIESIFTNTQIHKTTKQFLFILIENNRFPLIYKIIKSYNDLLLINDGYAFAEVDTAMPLSKSSCKNIEDFVTDLTNAKPIITYNTKKDLLGGITIKINNKVLDLSLKGKMKKIGNLLLETSINKQGF